MFNAALDLLGRLGLVTVLGAIGAVAITRLLGPTDYGSYASAIATVAILGAASDLGFTVMLSRDAADSPAAHRPMLRAAYHVASAWSAALTMVLIALALSAGLSTDRGMVLLVLAPSMLFNGLNPARAFLVITQRTRTLLAIDVAITALQVAASIAVAAAGLGPLAVGVTVSIGSIVDNIVVAMFVGGRLAPSDSERYSRRLLLWRSAPLGLASILTRIYLTIDLVLLGWLVVAGPRLGQYAAAAKTVSILGGVSGTVMSGVLPTLAREVAFRREVDELVARIWHWLVVVPLPAFVALILFAGPIIRLAFGHRYAGASSLLQILAVAGCISVLSNLSGTLLVIYRKNRAMVIQNSVAIVFNVIGNLVFDPALRRHRCGLDDGRHRGAGVLGIVDAPTRPGQPPVAGARRRSPRSRDRDRSVCRAGAAGLDGARGRLLGDRVRGRAQRASRLAAGVSPPAVERMNQAQARAFVLLRHPSNFAATRAYVESSGIGENG